METIVSKINKKMLKLSLIFNGDSNSSIYDYNPDKTDLVYKSIGLEFNILKRTNLKDLSEKELITFLENLEQIEMDL